jgi:hypothetical protein
MGHPHSGLLKRRPKPRFTSLQFYEPFLEISLAFSQLGCVFIDHLLAGIIHYQDIDGLGQMILFNYHIIRGLLQ